MKRLEFFNLDPDKALDLQSENLIKMYDHYEVEISEFNMVVVKDEDGKDKIVVGVLGEPRK